MSLGVDDLRRLSALLDEALDLDAPARERWLDALRGDDLRLAATLRDLLAREASRETGDVLERGPAFTAPPADEAGPTFRPGDTVGPYRLQREIGHGGMGEVWLAERTDGQLKRPVALKLPMLGARRSVLVQRFARERDILGALVHPHIARLYDAGLAEDGQPYLALEVVEGVPITAYCDAKGLDARARVQLVLQVMDAVQYAHANLVIHRDIKPSNVLVTARGQAMLLDFGIAKLLADEQGQAHETELTQLGGRALTLDYAAPEQVAGAPISIATDVHAIGVLLYELLAGQRPFRGARREVEQAILGREPPRPKALPADLATIVLKALKKAPAERYATVAAFADDLGRWLDGLPVRARPDSGAYRLRRFVGRHRVGVAAGTAVVLALVTAAVVSVQQARVARAEARTAQAVQDFLQGVFRASSGDQPDPMKARQRSARDLLDEGAARIDASLADAPQAKLQVLELLASIYEDMGLLDRMAELRGRAAAVAAAVHGEGGNVHVMALAEHARALNAATRNQEAHEVLARADRLVAAQPRPDPQVRIAVDIAIADMHNYVGDPRGLPHAERAMALLRQTPLSADWLNGLGLLGGLRRAAGDFDGSRQVLEEAIEIEARLPGGAASKLPAIYELLAMTERASGNGDRAIELIRKVVAMDEAASGPDSVHTLTGELRLVSTLIEQGRFAEAMELAARLRARVTAWPDTPEKAANEPWVHRYEAAALVERGFVDAALRSLQQVRDTEQLVATDPRLVFGTQVALGDLRTMRGELGAADAALDRAERLMHDRDLGAGDRSLLADVRTRRLLAQGRPAEARQALRPVLDTTTGDAVLPLRRAVLRATVALAEGDPAGAEAIAREALAAMAGGGPPSRGRRVHEPALQALLARTLLLRQRPQEALPLLQAALQAEQAMRDPQLSLVVAAVHVSLGECLLDTGRVQDARESLALARAIHARHELAGPQLAAPLQALADRLDAARAAAPR